MMNFCGNIDFQFIIEYLAHNDININDIDNIDLLYENVYNTYLAFECSPYFTQDTSWLQSIKDFFNN